MRPGPSTRVAPTRSRDGQDRASLQLELLGPGRALRRVLIVSGSVGAGHDGAARELAQRLGGAGVEVDVRDLLDVLPPLVRRVLRDGYTLTVQRVPWLFEAVFRALEGSLGHAVMLRVCRAAQPGVLAWLRDGAYDAVVSTYPLAGQVLGELRARGHARLPLVTYLTDPAVHRSWLHPRVDLHLTVLESTAAQGRRAYGLPFTAAGPLVPERFGRPCSAAGRARLRAELGLPDEAPVALLVAGSLGIGDLLPTVEHVVAAGVVPLVLCGRNRQLQRRLQQVRGAVVLGWRDDVHDLMQICDLLVHNAGGLSFTEALVAGLPAISYRCIPGHGRANAALLEAAGLAPWPQEPDALQAAVSDVLRRERRRPHLSDPVDTLFRVLAAARPVRHRLSA